MNVITVAEIKRSGFAVLETALARGPVHLMKRNRPSAVVLLEADYARLCRQAGQAVQMDSASALDIFLSQPLGPEPGMLDDAAMQQRLAELREGWSER
ncbi:MAG: hypothetical protein ACKVOO_11580 [Burkholderiaceae bacterium]